MDQLCIVALQELAEIVKDFGFRSPSEVFEVHLGIAWRIYAIEQRVGRSGCDTTVFRAGKIVRMHLEAAFTPIHSDKFYCALHPNPRNRMPSSRNQIILGDSFDQKKN